jgi:putative component of membrane protein insertase Oxa1/YidC/SpoIIIJ protein YidD
VGYRSSIAGLIERLLRSVTLGALQWAGRVGVPERLDRHAAHAGVMAIRCYRATLSPLLGRQCLFHPTCSHRAERLLRANGWNAGMPEVLMQVRRCCGTYRLRLGGDGRFELETVDGLIYPEEAIAPRLLIFGSSLKCSQIESSRPIGT